MANDIEIVSLKSKLALARWGLEKYAKANILEGWLHPADLARQLLDKIRLKPVVIKEVVVNRWDLSGEYEVVDLGGTHKGTLIVWPKDSDD